MVDFLNIHKISIVRESKDDDKRDRMEDPHDSTSRRLTCHCAQRWRGLGQLREGVD